MEGDGGRCHGEDVDDDLLKGIEKIKIDGIETGLGVCATSEHESINVVDIAFTTSIYED